MTSVFTSATAAKPRHREFSVSMREVKRPGLLGSMESQGATTMNQKKTTPSPEAVMQLQRHGEELKQNPSAWMPWTWNYRDVLAQLASNHVIE